MFLVAAIIRAAERRFDRAQSGPRIPRANYKHRQFNLPRAPPLIRRLSKGRRGLARGRKLSMQMRAGFSARGCARADFPFRGERRAARFLIFTEARGDRRFNGPDRRAAAR